MERGKTEDWCAAWRSTPSLFEGNKKGPVQRGWNYGVPGAAKNTGDDAWLVAPKRSEGGLFEN